MAIPVSSSGQGCGRVQACVRGWFEPLATKLASQRVALAVFSGALLLTGILEWSMGRSFLGPDGKFGLWQGNIWSSECSQRVADPYSFSHVAHGILFYAGLWLIGRRWPIRNRLIIATLIEAAWELLENSPVMIERYRQTTIALGYDGDSILNSLSDVLMMAVGFFIAFGVRPW